MKEKSPTGLGRAGCAVVGTGGFRCTGRTRAAGPGRPAGDRRAGRARAAGPGRTRSRFPAGGRTGGAVRRIRRLVRG
mgnify:CR=1 FL=1